MKRTGERGENKWAQISWDEAYDTIVEKYHAIVEKYGSESVLTVAGTAREAGGFATALSFRVFDSPNAYYAHTGWSCYGPRLAVTSYALGAPYPEMDYAGQYPDRYDDPRFKLPECIMLWGKHPLESNPDGFFGHSITDMMRLGTKLIVVDPRMTWLSSRAEYALQLRPGTDTALALAMLNVIINEDLYDHDFVDKWCFGFDKLSERVQEYPPAKVADITWVPADKIIAAARFFAKAKPASIGWGVAVDQKCNGVQNSHAVIALMAITGNVDAPGGNIIGAMPYGTKGWGWNDLTESKKDLIIGLDEFPAVPTTLQYAHPDVVLDVLETGKPYPLKMGFFQSCNALNCPVAAPERFIKAYDTLEFIVVSDTFMNPTASALADIFLPIASWAEHDGLVATHGGAAGIMVGVINKAIEVGETRSDTQILLDLGKRLRPELWPWESVTEMLTATKLIDTLGVTFEELREKGWMQWNAGYKKYETGGLRFDNEPGFMTPTGLVELYSTVFEAWGEDPLPYFEEPPYSPISTPEICKEYPLVLTTGARSFAYFHSEQRQVKSLREVHPDPLVEIHPDTAAKLGIIDGDWVTIENQFGKCKQKAKLTLGIDPRVVHAQHGWWYPEKDAAAPTLLGFRDANINMLIPNKLVGKLGFGSPIKCNICKVYKD
jgi:anaerobic selenocysteine-containing dehydrogenase